jgi:TonB family protein
MPRYPEMLRSANFSGEAELAVPISERGVLAGRPVVIESSHELFTFAVKSAVAGWRFRPAIVDGKVRADTVRVRFVFAIDTSSRCGPATIILRDGEQRQKEPSVEPQVTFDTTKLTGTVTACRVPRLVYIVH